MIAKISSAKNFGVFNDFKWDKHVDQFKRYNLFYGFNAAGKTTLSKIFSCLENKSITDDYPEGRFVIETDANQISSDDLDKNTLLVKVFNSDYVRKNFFFDEEKHCNAIFYLRKTKEYNDEIESLENSIKDIENKHRILNEKYNNSKNEEGKGLTKSASDIKNILRNSKFPRYNEFNKDHLQKEIDKYEGKDSEYNINITDSEYENYREIIQNTKSLPHIEKINYPNFANNYYTINSYEELYTHVNQLLKTDLVKTAIINRFQTSLELNEWAKQGYKIIKENGLKHCPFCDGELDIQFIENLEKYFNKEYDDLVLKINEMLHIINNLVSQNSELHINSEYLYPDIQKEAIALLKEYAQSKIIINNELKEMESKLISKKSNPYLKDVTTQISIPDNFANPSKIIGKLNSLIEKHNTMCREYDSIFKDAQEKVFKYEIITRAPSLIKKANEKNNLYNDYTECKFELEEKQNLLNQLKKKHIDKDLPLEKINTILKSYFGKRYLELALSQNINSGYSINRDNNCIAKNLSESEKNAIAFTYFIASDDDKQDTIYFIDDPVSSFDNNHIYYCSSLITETYKNAKQLFISTHSFSFFNRIKKWNRLPPNDTMVYEITRNKNITNISQFPRELLKLDSEYQYLFVKLYRYHTNTNKRLEDEFQIGNLARRFIEMYVNVKLPNNDNFKNKLYKIGKEIEGISQDDLDEIYPLINEMSHERLMEDANNFNESYPELNNIIAKIFLLVEKTDKEHFDCLKKVYSDSL